MNVNLTTVRTTVALLLVLVTAGCDRSAPTATPTSPGSPSPSPTPAAPLNLTGTWTGSITDHTGARNDTTLRLTQTNQTVSGTITWTGGANTAAGTFAATVTGRTISFRINIPVGGFTSPASSRFCLATLLGTASSTTAGAEFSGDYTGTNTCIPGLVPFPGALSVNK